MGGGVGGNGLPKYATGAGGRKYMVHKGGSRLKKIGRAGALEGGQEGKLP